MICCTSAIPVLSGLSERLHRFIGGASMIFACIWSIFCTSCEQSDELKGKRLFGVLTTCQPSQPTGSLSR